MIIIGRVVLFFMALAMATAAWAQAPGKFPTKPIHWIVDYPAGGLSDILARQVGQKLTEAWGVPVIVDNRPGANGIIAYDLIAKAAPDGYTIGLASTPLALNPSLRDNLPFNAKKDFVPLALMAQTPNVLIANPQINVKTVKDLIDLAKTRHNGLDYASVGPGSSPHLSSEMLKKDTGLNATHVPYNGSGPALVDLIAGRVDFMFVNLPAALPQIRNGKVVVLGVADERRSPLLPDTPTLIETGIPDFISIGWYGAVAPAGMPPELVARYNTEINRILKLPDVREKIESFGAEPGNMNPAQYAAFIDKDTQRWAKIVKDTGASANN
ncbi:MAG TPA: tripartite tricarboxylate transporter substrate binding protein [Bordetella sp.]|nr:tripartite tricarboxylate transporter substrate binding protein [Bordetella sp.]